MNKKVLIVDDNHDLSDCLAVLLAEQGYDTSVVYNGEDAVKKVRDEPFDLAIIDVKLPGINGVEVFRTIRKINPEMEGIMMTGYQMDQLLAEAINDGSVSVLRKPFPMARLSAKISDIQQKGILLIVDDDPEFVSSMEQYLIQQHYKVLIAQTDKQASDCLMQESIDILVLDLKRPIIHALDIYLGLNEKGYTIPTIIVTGYTAQEAGKPDALRSMSVTGCLFKPFSPEDLFAGINNILNSGSG